MIHWLNSELMEIEMAHIAELLADFWIAALPKPVDASFRRQVVAAIEGRLNELHRDYLRAAVQ
nr:hypothetical protein [Brevundimonas naejangsanensis]